MAPHVELVGELWIVEHVGHLEVGLFPRVREMRAYLVAGVDAEAGLFPDDPTEFRVPVAHLDLALSPVFAPVGCARGLALQGDGLPVEIHVPDVPDVFRPVKG